MINRSTRRSSTLTFAAIGSALLLAVAAAPASAAPSDTRVAQADTSSAKTGRRAWNLGDFTWVRLVPRESGAPANEQPVQIEPEMLRRQLALVRIGRDTGSPTLFAPNELGDLQQPLVDALANARPEDDVLLLSSARRSGAFLQPTAVTARLFVQGGRLNLIVNDTRRSYVDELRGSHTQPEFDFGSRAAASRAVLQANGADSRRADWLAWPVAAFVPGAATATAAPVAPVAAPPAAPAAAAPAPAAAPAATAGAAAGAAAAAPGAAPARPRDANFGDEAEQRLTTLKRLRDKGLITEDEYQQKRREVLQSL